MLDDRPQGAFHVLIVEDWLPLARELRYRFESAGLQVVGPAPRLERAFGLLEQHTVDLAVLDVDLNGERVFPLAYALRERGVPFIFVSGFDEIEFPPDLRAELRFSKPVEFPRLLSAVRARL